MPKASAVSRQKPFINVTPLIDVLLVLLIIFMVVSPLRQSRFEAKIPQPKDEYERPLPPRPDTLVVTIGLDHSLKLNSLGDLGTVEDPSKLTAKLSEVFALRTQNHAYSPDMFTRTDLPEALRIQKTVFIKGPRSLNYGDVVKVIDGIKGAGAAPIGLQIDDLN
ncbi:MAG TPA: biopolymer transporter ExbD [Pyrinomonadaceae bacterium]|nr:biopolymer transporter ExbD [Pyrinomonadaceae bacterium]